MVDQAQVAPAFLVVVIPLPSPPSPPLPNKQTRKVLVFRYSGYLIGALMITESYYLGIYIQDPILL